MEKGKADRGTGITARLWDSSLIQNSASESLQIGQRSEMKGSITMKKLMIAASAALCATVSLAELASANIVGYSNLDVGKTSGSGQAGTFSLNTFLGMSGAENMTLGDISVNSVYDVEDADDYIGFYPGYDFIQIMDGSGKFVGKYTCWNQAALDYEEDEDAVAGWYEWDDRKTRAKSMNAVKIPFGSGFLVKAGSGGGVMPQFTYSGEVKKDVTIIPLDRTTITGNATPVNAQLGDFIVNTEYDEEDADDWVGFVPAYDFIQMMDAQTGKFVGKYTCWNQAALDYEEDEDAVAGWYEWDDRKTRKNVMNEVSVPAGSAFLVKTISPAGITPTLTIPKAIK